MLELWKMLSSGTNESDVVVSISSESYKGLYLSIVAGVETFLPTQYRSTISTGSVLQSCLFPSHMF